MRNTGYTAVISFLAATICANCLTACSDDEDVLTHSDITDKSGNTTENATSETVEANRFVYETMSTYYYWEAEMPALNYRRQTDTEEYFYKLLSSKDLFSFISDDADETLSEMVDAEYTEIGWDYNLSYLDAAGDTIVAIINYVYDGSPAKNGGVRRGDLIYAVDGTVMTRSNYSSLMGKTNATFTALRPSEEKTETVSYTLSAAAITENPISETAVFTLSDGKKVGYLLYNSFADSFNDAMVSAFRDFAAEGVTEMIIDLRYNRGGSVSSLCVLSSLVAPQSEVSNKSLLQTYEFNSLLKREGYGESLNFTDTLGVGLDLSRVIFLTGSNSYSASESTIWSLKPYMDVVMIGDTTGGKNSMMYAMTPEDFVYSNTNRPYYDESINNWMIAPIVAICQNATGKSFDTSGGYGLIPDFYVNEYAGLLSKGIKELGDAEETLTAAALRYLETGSTADNNKAVSTGRTVGRTIATAHDDRPAWLYDRKKR